MTPGTPQPHRTKWHGEDMSEATWKRIRSRVDTTDPDKCWLWTGFVNPNGYVQTIHLGRTVAAHRAAWAWINGPIPPGLYIDHICRQKTCVNPAHLRAITPAENVLQNDSVCALNARKTECLRGHPFDEANTAYLKKGGRSCRTCQRMHWAKGVAKRKGDLEAAA